MMAHDKIYNPTLYVHDFDILGATLAAGSLAGVFAQPAAQQIEQAREAQVRAEQQRRAPALAEQQREAKESRR